eukprot:scaffold33405_cov21-Tisochrysis_lutea.AAC.1
MDRPQDEDQKDRPQDNDRSEGQATDKDQKDRPQDKDKTKPGVTVVNIAWTGAPYPPSLVGCTGRWCPAPGAGVELCGRQPCARVRACPPCRGPWPWWRPAGCAGLSKPAKTGGVHSVSNTQRAHCGHARGKSRELAVSLLYTLASIHQLRVMPWVIGDDIRYQNARQQGAYWQRVLRVPHLLARCKHPRTERPTRRSCKS